jgi:hypothetical protein
MSSGARATSTRASRAVTMLRSGSGHRRTGAPPSAPRASALRRRPLAAAGRAPRAQESSVSDFYPRRDSPDGTAQPGLTPTRLDSAPRAGGPATRSRSRSTGGLGSTSGGGGIRTRERPRRPPTVFETVQWVALKLSEWDAHPVFKTGRAGQPSAWMVRFHRRSVAKIPRFPWRRRSRLALTACPTALDPLGAAAPAGRGAQGAPPQPGAELLLNRALDDQPFQSRARGWRSPLRSHRVAGLIPYHSASAEMLTTIRPRQRPAGAGTASPSWARLERCRR